MHDAPVALVTGANKGIGLRIASIAAAAERIRSELGRLDVLVNNAAISHTGRPDPRAA